jgi:pimeloyl-ACP methyl ester carboxylesterase
MKQKVILLHGIARTARGMATMARALSRKGYDVINIGYASRQKPIEELIDDIREELGLYETEEADKLHFVGHSMGGLVIRAYLNKYRPSNLGRVVMLGTPNQGSEVADLFASNFLYKAFYGPAGQQLITNQSGFSEMLGSPDYELGVIAGDRWIDPIAALFIIKGASDGRVPVARTQLEGMKDHVVLHVAHTFLPYSKDVIRQTAHFLEHGKFSAKK